LGRAPNRLERADSQLERDLIRFVRGLDSLQRALNWLDRDKIRKGSSRSSYRPDPSATIRTCGG